MYNKYFRIADLNIRMESEVPLNIVDYFKVFEKSENEDKINVIYKIKQIDSPIVFEKEPIYQNQNMNVYRVEGTEYRQFSWWNAHENYPITLKCGEKEPLVYEIYLTESQMRMFTQKIHFGGYLAMEKVMLINDTFQLHASVVEKNGKGILFTAPSGTGKSTQANLWKEYEKAVIINGDKAMIRKNDGKFSVYGSPYAGSSKIYKDISAPVHGIVVLAQAKENRIEVLPKAEAFMKIFKESVVNIWNEDYLIRLTGLIQELVSEVPIYYLACRPDKSAVNLLKKKLFL